MKQFKYTIDGKELLISFSERSGAPAAVTLDGAPVAPTAQEMPVVAGVIALALLTYETEVVHDEETSAITLERRCTPWNAPARQMKTL